MWEFKPWAPVNIVSYSQKENCLFPELFLKPHGFLKALKSKLLRLCCCQDLALKFPTPHKMLNWKWNLALERAGTNHSFRSLSYQKSNPEGKLRGICASLSQGISPTAWAMWPWTFTMLSDTNNRMMWRMYEQAKDMHVYLLLEFMPI